MKKTYEWGSYFQNRNTGRHDFQILLVGLGFGKIKKLFSIHSNFPKRKRKLSSPIIEESCFFFNLNCFYKNIAMKESWTKSKTIN